jgi:hypothetical protein
MAGILRTDTIQNSNTSTIITQTNSTTITIGTTGQTVALASGATSSGFGATYNGAVNWDTTAKTTGFTAVSGVGYFCNTTSSAFTVTLPASPSAGAIVAISDYANTFATNNLTVARNGSNIAGTASNSVLSTSGVSVTFVYVDSTQGWIVTDSGNRSDLPQPTFIVATGGTITTCGNYKIHTFTGPGTFTVSSVGNPVGGPNIADYMVVAGGGGGGGGNGGGGGGAGGFREGKSSPAPSYTASPLVAPAGITVTATGYPITVGSGGTFGIPASRGGPGNNSVFSTITSAGGGGGGQADSPNISGLDGGSGSGGGSLSSTPGSGGAGNTPPVSPSQGNPGGYGLGQNSVGRNGGGGGGATVAGSPAPSIPVAGAGGNGATTSISGTPTAYAGGGGGGALCGQGGAGGTGGGGSVNGSGTGVANSGGGGAGNPTGNPSPGSGGSGIVVIRYKYQ